MGVRAAEGAVAFDKTTLLTEQVMTDELNGIPIVAVADQRLDTGYIYLNPEEQTVTADGSTILVGGSSYEPDSLPLTSVYTFDAMWFAWHGYYPDTNV
ncbi:DUF3179 domain-containing (seleno)protein [Halorubrum sp. RMP-47]|uniref:DUF3179 domain-containing (Seleno)protein n=2 Tax=Halorubrum miltondacostae TaxID=3076378 RepID=A0ABD5M8K3_9EURY